MLWASHAQCLYVLSDLQVYIPILDMALLGLMLVLIHYYSENFIFKNDDEAKKKNYDSITSLYNTQQVLTFYHSSNVMQDPATSLMYTACRFSSQDVAERRHIELIEAWASSLVD